MIFNFGPPVCNYALFSLLMIHDNLMDDLDCEGTWRAFACVRLSVTTSTNHASGSSAEGELTSCSAGENVESSGLSQYPRWLTREHALLSVSRSYMEICVASRNNS